MPTTSSSLAHYKRLTHKVIYFKGWQKLLPRRTMVVNKRIYIMYIYIYMKTHTLVVNKRIYIYIHEDSYIRTHNISFRVITVMLIIAETTFFYFVIFAAMIVKNLVTWVPGNKTPTVWRILRNVCTLLSECHFPQTTSLHFSVSRGAVPSPARG
jgi:hypothetical protein